MSLRVLLVEDDRALRATLRDALAVEGHTVLAAASLADARALLRHARAPVTPDAGVGGATGASAGEGAAAVDLVLLDLTLPDGDGETLLAEMRSGRGAAPPVIVLSAREAEGQKIRLLDAGADDYLVKPFGIGELLARMRVALRHRGRPSRPAVRRWRAGDVDVDLETRRVRRAGADVHLTPKEFDLLARLVRQAGQVVTHRQLLADVWGAEHTEQTHYLRLFMGQLRAKLETDPAEPQHLLTEPGVGYRLAEGESDE